MGTRDGSIIATIITTHMPRNDVAAPGHVCSGIRIHAIDIVQPPGIGIPPIADMDVDQAIVSVALAAKSNAETPTKVASEGRSEAKRRELSSPAVAATTTTPSSAPVLVVAAPRSTGSMRARSRVSSLLPACSDASDHLAWLASASRFRKAASPAADTSTHFLSGEASAS